MVSSRGLTIVANRLPVDIVQNNNGEIVYRRSPGGLVTALEPLLRENGGAWIGWPGNTGNAGNPTINQAENSPFIIDGIVLAPVQLSHDEITYYYEGFSNTTLWPLYHDRLEQPEFHRQWWVAYESVNRKFAEVTAATARQGDIVWIQDYQLQLVPQMLRELRPDLVIGFFLHIPFPPPEIFMQIPTRDIIVKGLLGADVLGFHLQKDADNFLALVQELSRHPRYSADFSVNIYNDTIKFHNRSIHVGNFPISINSTTINDYAQTPEIIALAQKMRSELGFPQKILLGVDRLDYTKGIDVRLRAFQGLLTEHRIDPAEIIFIQIATSSRENVESYKKLRNTIELLITQINGKWGSLSRPAVHYIHRQVTREELVAFFTIADVMLVTPLRDGMNLVAKEYLACRTQTTGALVLSEFTGAAVELSDAYIVNPYDIEDVEDAIYTALHQSAEEEKRRMTALRKQVLYYDVSYWANKFLTTLRLYTHEH